MPGIEELDLMGGCGKDSCTVRCTAHNNMVLAIKIGQEMMKRFEEVATKISETNHLNAQTMAQIGARMEEHISIHKVTESLLKRQEDGEKAQEERAEAHHAQVIAAAVASAIHETLEAVVPKVIPKASRWETLGWSLLEKLLWVIAAAFLIQLLDHNTLPKLLGGG